MIQVYNGALFTAKGLSVQTAFKDCVLPDVQDHASLNGKMQVFSALKSRGFSFDTGRFDENGHFRGDNYGNYQLDKIEFSDFLPVRSDKFMSDLQDCILSVARLDEKGVFLATDIDAYITAVQELSQFFIPALTHAAIFRFGSNTVAIKSKKHPYYSLWEHFHSYIVFNSRNHNQSFVYIEIGYD